MLRRNPSPRGKYEMPLEENHLGGINNTVSPGNRYDCINDYRPCSNGVLIKSTFLKGLHSKKSHLCCTD